MKKTKTDNELMQATGDINAGIWSSLKQGDEKSFYDCFHCAYNDLFRLGIFLYKDPELVKESIHLLFIELWKIRAKLDAVNNVKEYAFTIFKRILFKQKTGAVNHWSKIDLLETDTFNGGTYTTSYEEVLISLQDEKQAKLRLASLLEQLSDRQKQLLRMRYYEDKTIDEIAALTSLTCRTIYNTIQNAMVRLKELSGEQR